MWLEQFEKVLPREAHSWVLCHEPQSLEEVVLLMAAFETAIKSTVRGKKEAGTRKEGHGGKSMRGRGTPLKTESTNKGRI